MFHYLYLTNGIVFGLEILCVTITYVELWAVNFFVRFENS
jgi:hypothetical protein